MAIRIHVDTDRIRRVRQSLIRLQRNTKGNAWKELLDSAARDVEQGLRRQWGVDMRVRDRGFQQTMYRIIPSQVAAGIPTSPSRVMNRSADTMLRLQVHGGIRRPERATRLKIPPGPARYGIPIPRTPQTFVDGTGRHLLRRLPGGGVEFLASLRRNALIPPRYRIQIPIRQVEVGLRRRGDRILQRHIDRWEATVR